MAKAPRKRRAKSLAGLKPERVDDGSAKAPRGLSPLDAASLIPSAAEQARLRELLQGGWALARELSFPSAETVLTALAFFDWAAQQGKGSPATSPIRVRIELASEERGRTSRASPLSRPLGRGTT